GGSRRESGAIPPDLGPTRATRRRLPPRRLWGESDASTRRAVELAFAVDATAMRLCLRTHPAVLSRAPMPAISTGACRNSKMPPRRRGQHCRAGVGLALHPIGEYLLLICCRCSKVK